MDKNVLSLLDNKIELKINEIPLITFAFYGDAVHTLMVRKYLLNNGICTPNNLHKMASKLCSANFQAESLDILKIVLNEDENEFIRRARNTKTHKPPKSCDLEIYKKATSFEALIGYLTLKRDYNRLKELFTLSVKNKEIKC